MTPELAIANGLPVSPWARAEQDKAQMIWTRPAGKVTLARQDLVFFGTSAEHVYIEVTLRNTADVATTPTTARISAAPLGAFVPWQPLVDLPVNTLPPRASTTLRAEVARSRRGPRTDSLGLTMALRLFLRSQGIRVSRQESHVHWAGNLDVFVHDHSVERHQARLPGLVPGAMNMADFVVGGPLADAYMFEITGDLGDIAARL